MKISNETFLKIKSGLVYSALPRRHGEHLLIGFQHRIDSEEAKKLGAVSGIQAGEWLRQDIERAERLAAQEDPDAPLDEAVLKRFS